MRYREGENKRASGAQVVVRSFDTEQKSLQVDCHCCFVVVVVVGIWILWVCLTIASACSAIDCHCTQSHLLVSLAIDDDDSIDSKAKDLVPV